MIDPGAIRFRPVDRAKHRQLMSQYPELSPLVAELLVARGYCEKASVDNFFHPTLEDLHDPFELRDMEKAASILRECLENGQRILIHGDYDCDGICATSVLMEGLSELGADLDYHIPDRFEEGYGLSMKAVERCQEENFHLLLSVDCGSSSHAEIEAAMAAGIKVVITDHHKVPDNPPQPHALVNPQHPEDRYPFKGLCGTAVAFKLLQALRGLSGTDPKHLLDLVALATIADVVPLVEENRALVQFGLEVLSQTDRLGVKALLEASGRENPERVDAFTVGFGLAPRLNAAGRLEHARAGVELMLSRSLKQARELAARLDSLNEERKECERAIGQEIEERLERDPQRWQRGVIVEWGEGWHEGVIGITAGRLSEKFGVPALVIATDGENAKGSGRAPENVNLYLALKECAHVFSKYGGHPRAAGFSLPSANLETLSNDMEAAVERLRDGPAPIWVDAAFGLQELDIPLVRELEKLEPFGEANPKPSFLLEGATIVGHRTVGKNRDHLQLELEQGGERRRAIAFRQGPLIDQIEAQKFRYDVVCQVGVDLYKGQQQLKIQVRGLVRPQCCEPSSQSLVVDRRHVRHRRRELAAWLDREPGYLAACRDAGKAAQAYPEFAARFRTYTQLKEEVPGLLLVSPPSNLEELESALEAARPSRIVVLFGVKELDAVENALEAGPWGRGEAITVWRKLFAQARRPLLARAIVDRFSRSLRMRPYQIEQILECFQQTGVLQSRNGQLTVTRGQGVKLEETESFRRYQDRSEAFRLAREMFTGPTLEPLWLERWPWLDPDFTFPVASPG